MVIWFLRRRPPLWARIARVSLVVGSAAAAAIGAEVLRRRLGIGMPRVDGIEATRRIKRLLPDTAVIFLTVYSTHLMDALAAGGSRYLLKDCPVDELLGAIRSCAGEGARVR